MNPSVNYEEDFYLWILHNVDLLRQGKFAEADIENITEELESIGKRDKRELINRFTVLLAHLLKWQFESERCSKSWERTIDEQRVQIHLILKDSPSLQYQLDERIADSYKLAIRAAVKETGLNKDVFPEACPYTLNQILDENFYPEMIISP